MAARLLIGLLLLIGAALGGLWAGIEWEEGQQAKRERAAQQQRHDALVARIERDRKNAALVAAELDGERAGREIDRALFEKELAHAPRERIIECPAAISAASVLGPAASGNAAAGLQRADGRDPGAPRLGPLGNRLWNEALSFGATQAERAEWLASANAAPGPVEIDDALRNLRANAELLGECRKREQMTREWMRREGLAP